MTPWLIDKSALVRLGHSTEATEWADRIERGLVRIANVTRLEVGYSASSGGQARAEFRTPPLSAMSVEVQLLLADQGHHRAPSISDLLIAATAELAGLTVLHLDKDFDLIAAITGQQVERLLA